MPTPSYLSIIGSTQGVITQGAGSVDSIGDRSQRGHEDQILVQAMGHTVTLSTSRQSGAVTGTRIHLPFKVTCEINSAIPLLYNALVTGEQLSEVVMSSYRTSINGKQEHFFDTILVGARVNQIETLLPDSRHPDSKPFNNFVNIFFSYRRIEHIHLPCGTVGIDDWRASREVV